MQSLFPCLLYGNVLPVLERIVVILADIFILQLYLLHVVLTDNIVQQGATLNIGIKMVKLIFIYMCINLLDSTGLIRQCAKVRSCLLADKFTDVTFSVL